MKIEILTKPQGKILGEYINSDARVSLIRGPLGSGKTYASCNKILNIIINQKPDANGVRKTRGYAIRNTYSDLLTTTIKDWLDLFGDLGKFTSSLAPPPTHKMRFRLPDKTIVESELIFLALDKPQSIKRLRGSQVTFFWLNEVKELPKPVIDMADGRHGRFPSAVDGGPSWHGMIGDYNSPDDDHWLYRLAEEEKPEGWEFFTQPGGVLRERDENGKWTGKWIPNPEAENMHNLPTGYYERMVAGKSDDWIAVNLANEYGNVRTGQAIYEKQWDDTVHVNPDIQPVQDETLILAFDFGLTPAAVFLQETSSGLQQCHEAVGQGIGITQFAKHVVKPIIHKHYKDCPIVVVGDPAGRQRTQTDMKSPFDVLHELGLPIQAASTNVFDIRCDNVRNILTSWFDKKPLYQLHPRCKYTRKGFNGGYCLRRIQVVGDEKYTSVPDKNIYSHVHEALQYAADYICAFLLTSAKGSYNSFVRSHSSTY